MRYFFLRLYYQAFHMRWLEYKHHMIASSLEPGALVPAPNWQKEGQLRYLGECWFLFESSP